MELIEPTISDYSFSNCANLEYIDFPDKLTNIGDAFNGCNFEYIISHNIVPPVLKNAEAFEKGVLENAILYVPFNSSSAYSNSYGWREFKNIQEKDFGGVNSVKDDAVSITVNGGSIEIDGADNAHIEVYNLSGQLVYSGTDITVDSLARGIYIIRVAGQTFKIAL